MYNIEDIEAIHIELTEKCNLSCLMCDRNKNGGEVNQYLKDRELTFDNISHAFSVPFIQQLKRVYFCGNYGDPIFASDIMYILKYFKNINSKIKLAIVTNGSAHSVSWWNDLAQIVDVVRFGIDGLEDTHKIYRQNANWNRIIENATFYIKGGGYAIWDYLVFEHNEHQVEEAKELSKKIGFKEFIVKKTGRFFSNIRLEGKESHEGLSKPKQEQNINKSLMKEQQIKDKYGSMNNYLDKCDIDCKVLKNKEIYLSAEGIVLPCCWLAGQMYKWYMKPQESDIWNLIEDKNKINIKYNSLENIFESRIFDRIQNTWRISSIKKGKQKTCALKCGKELDQFGDQFK